MLVCGCVCGCCVHSLDFLWTQTEARKVEIRVEKKKKKARSRIEYRSSQFYFNPYQPSRLSPSLVHKTFRAQYPLLGPTRGTHGISAKSLHSFLLFSILISHLPLNFISSIFQQFNLLLKIKIVDVREKIIEF